MLKDFYLRTEERLKKIRSYRKTNIRSFILPFILISFFCYQVISDIGSLSLVDIVILMTWSFILIIGLINFFVLKKQEETIMMIREDIISSFSSLKDIKKKK